MSTAEETAGGEAQPWGEVTPDAARRLLLAAVEAFAERGYHATTTRDIAGRAGMSPAALYIHYKTKEELLHRISRIGHEKVLEVLRWASCSEGSATERLAGAGSSFVRWHAGGRTTARVVQYELDFLGPDARAEIRERRRRVGAGARTLIEEGCGGGSAPAAARPRPAAPRPGSCSQSWPTSTTTPALRSANCPGRSTPRCARSPRRAPAPAGSTSSTCPAPPSRCSPCASTWPAG